MKDKIKSLISLCTTPTIERTNDMPNNANYICYCKKTANYNAYRISKLLNPYLDYCQEHGGYKWYKITEQSE